MSIFAIADLHLSFGVDKPMDIFSGWKDYDLRIEKNWNLLVKPDDTVVIAGDISWAMQLEEAKPDFEFIHRLNGKKIILRGNHDYWWCTKAKCDKFLSENGFDSISLLFNNSYTVEGISICGSRGWFYDLDENNDKKVLNREAGRLRLSLESAKNMPAIVFMHYPPVYGDYECKEILDVLNEYGIKECYYGHIHGGAAARKAITGDYKGIKYKMISCDNTDFFPVLVRK